MRRHPNVDLLETLFQAFFEVDEELSVLGRVGNINEDANQLVSIKFSLMTPLALYDLRFRRCGAELSFQFQECVSHKLRRNWTIIIEPRGQQYFETPEWLRHK